MTSSLDMTLCRRCGEPMAAVVNGGALPRYLCRMCGDLDLPAHLPTVPPRLAVEVLSQRRPLVSIAHLNSSPALVGWK